MGSAVRRPKPSKCPTGNCRASSSKPEEIIWTSGATESINLALKGAALARRDRGGHVVTSPLEHKAVLDSATWLESQGFEISYAEPDESGRITTENILEALRPDTIIVSLMYVNNETGAVTDFASLGPKLRQHGALLHVDAVQGAARMPLDDVASEADLISISAHKMYGPKGIGVLCIRKPLCRELTPRYMEADMNSGYDRALCRHTKSSAWGKLPDSCGSGASPIQSISLPSIADFAPTSPGSREPR